MSVTAAVWEPRALVASPGRQTCIRQRSMDVALSAHTELGLTAGGQRKLSSFPDEKHYMNLGAWFLVSLFKKIKCEEFYD